MNTSNSGSERAAANLSFPLLSPEECGVLLGRDGACAASGSSRPVRRPVSDAALRRMTLEMPSWMADYLDRESRRLGMTPRALALSWIARHIKQSASPSE